MIRVGVRRLGVLDFLVSVSIRELHQLLQTEPFTSLLEFGLSLLELEPHLLGNLQLKVPVYLRNV